jgi:septal ring-binding cell division protein DamX
MASGGKKGSAGDRVLEGRHVIGLFMLMLLFSGVFFTLGYVMGRNQNDGQVSASTGLRSLSTPEVLPKSEIAPKTASKKPVPAPQNEPAPPASSDWEFYHAGDSNKTDDRLKPATASPAPVPTVSKNGGATKQVNVNAPGKANALGAGGLNLQVAALTKEVDAMALANSLRKKNFPTFVQAPQGDKYYRVLVGPYADQKSADNAKKGLEVAGFKAILKR